MSRHRSTELGVVPLRAGRFLCIGQKWYFACREGHDQGPFNSQHEAESALKQYINKLNHYPVTKQNSQYAQRPATPK